EVGADLGFAGPVVGDGGVKLGVQQFQSDGAVGIGGLLEPQGEDGTDQLVLFALGTEEVAQRVGHKDRASVGRSPPLCVLHHMGMGAYHHISAPVCQLLSQSLLRLGDGVAVLNTPVGAYHHKVCQLGRFLDLLLNDIGLVGVDDVGLHGILAGDAVGVLGVGQIGNGNAVHRVHRDVAIVRLAPPQTGG